MSAPSNGSPGNEVVVLRAGTERSVDLLTTRASGSTSHTEKRSV